MRRKRVKRRSRRRFKRRIRRTHRRSKYAAMIPHSIKRMCYYTLTGPNGGTPVPTYGAFQFQLGDLPNNAEFVNLYDQYRINGVKLRFFPPAETAVTPGGSLGTFHMFNDYDDAIAPGSLAEMLQRPDHTIMAMPSRPFKRYVVPRISTPGYQASGLQGNAVPGKPRTWLDTSYTNILHYGIKWMWNTNNAETTGQIMVVYATYYLSFKGIK